VKWKVSLISGFKAPPDTGKRPGHTSLCGEVE